MGISLVYLLIAISSVMAVALAISLPTALLWLPALLAMIGLTGAALLAVINRNASLRDLSAIGSGSGKTKRSRWRDGYYGGG